MKFKNELINKLSDLGFDLGCYDTRLEDLSKADRRKVLSNVYEEHTDVEVTLYNKPHIVEISSVDLEKDFNVLASNVYKERYGNN